LFSSELEKKEKSDAAAAYETVDEGLTSDTTDIASD
jgi:hypothetical protein